MRIASFTPLPLTGLTLLPAAAQAQPNSGSPAPGTPTTPANPTDVPRDGEASLLLAGGVG